MRVSAIQKSVYSKQNNLKTFNYKLKENEPIQTKTAEINFKGGGGAWYGFGLGCFAGLAAAIAVSAAPFLAPVIIMAGAAGGAAAGDKLEDKLNGTNKKK